MKKIFIVLLLIGCRTASYEFVKPNNGADSNPEPDPIPFYPNDSENQNTIEGSENMSIEKALNYVYQWQYDYRESQAGYYIMLLDLIAKADEENIAKLECIYPEIVKAYTLWKKQGDRIFTIYKTKENRDVDGY